MKNKHLSLFLALLFVLIGVSEAYCEISRYNVDMREKEHIERFNKRAQTIQSYKIESVDSETEETSLSWMASSSSPLS